MGLNLAGVASGSGSGSQGTASRFTFVAFRDKIETSAASVTVWTHTKYNSRLGMLDQLVLQGLTNSVTVGAGPARLQVQIEHSADGLNWSAKSATPDIDATLNLYGTTYLPLAIDDGSTPSLGFVRLALTLTAFSGGVHARVKITATCNDHHQHQFAERAKKFQAAHDVSDYYYLCYPGGTPISVETFTKKQLKTLIDNRWIVAGVIGEVRFLLEYTCCFNQQGDFIVVKGKDVLFASVNA